MHRFNLAELVSIKVGRATGLGRGENENENGQFSASHSEVRVNRQSIRPLVSQIRAIVLGYKQY